MSQKEMTAMIMSHLLSKKNSSSQRSRQIMMMTLSQTLRMTLIVTLGAPWGRLMMQMKIVD